MKRKFFAVERSVTMLREAEVRISQGRTIRYLSRELGITEQAYYSWKKVYGGMKVLRKQPKRGPLWLNDGGCVRLRPTPIAAMSGLMT